MAIPNRSFAFPTAVKFGTGRVRELADHCRDHGMARPLFVTDPGLAAMPMVKQIVADLKKAGLGVAAFSDVRPNPVEANIREGVKAYKHGNHDGVIAFRARRYRRLVEESKPKRHCTYYRGADDGRNRLGGGAGRRGHSS
jgi:hypothetical protein